jgi:putative endonuclease
VLVTEIHSNEHATMRKGYVYMLASKKGGTLYVGVTSNLAQRVSEHESGKGSAFTAQYGVKRLIWFEEHDLVGTAITREKTIKKWPRQWKINAIEAANPEWNDLRSSLI